MLLNVSNYQYLFSHAEKDEKILNDPTPRVLLGLCTGLLPAIATASAIGVADLLKLSPEIIRISLRLGVEVSHRSQNLEQSLSSWASIVSGVPLDQIRAELQQFHDSKVQGTFNVIEDSG